MGTLCRRASLVLHSQDEPAGTAGNVPREVSTHASLQQAAEHLPSPWCGTSSPAHPKGNYVFQLRKLQFTL